MIAILTSVSVRGMAAEITAMRVSSRADRTRVVVQLDGPTRYQTQYTSEPSLSIYLLGTGIGQVSRTTSIDDGLVGVVSLKEVMGNMVDVNISLKREVSFTVFPIESPDRIVIDIMPTGAAMVAGRESVSSETVDGATSPHEETDTTSASSAFGSISQLQSAGYSRIQLCINALLMVAVAAIGIRLWRVTRVLKKNQNFADVIGEVRARTAGRSGGAERHDAATAKSDDASRDQKKKKKRERDVQPASLRKQYEKVYKLAQLGMDRLAISQQSNVPIGEVNLILDLSKARSQNKVN